MTVRKMDDVLPRLLFNSKNLESCVRNNRLDLFIALYPTTALLLAIMEESLNRSERLALLSDAFCMMLVYHMGLVSYTGAAGCEVSIRRNKSGRPPTVWNREFIHKFLSSVFLIAKVLCDPRAVNLAALGSHHNENYFGCIKRLSHDDESVETFLRTSQKAFLLRTLLLLQGLESPKQCARVSMSGARIQEQWTPGDPVAVHLCRAWFVWRQVVTFSKGSLALQLEQALMPLAQSMGLVPWRTAMDALGLLPEGVTSGPRNEIGSVTARKMRLVSVDRVKCNQRWMTGKQLEFS